MRDLRVAELIRQDVTIENGEIVNYRVRLGISFTTATTDPAEGGVGCSGAPDGRQLTRLAIRSRPATSGELSQARKHVQLRRWPGRRPFRRSSRNEQAAGNAPECRRCSHAAGTSAPGPVVPEAEAGIDRPSVSCLVLCESGSRSVESGLQCSSSALMVLQRAPGREDEAHSGGADRQPEVAAALIAGDQVVEHSGCNLVGGPRPDGAL